MADVPTVVVPSQELVGHELGGTYVVLRQITEGGMGSIYEARHVRLPKKFAIKVMLRDAAADPVMVERFRREAEAASALGNPHIATVVDFNLLPNGSPYLVMEHLEGEDLWRRLGRQPKLGPRAAARILLQVADGLLCAHEHGIVHRDVKPSNIFLTQQARGGELVKLLDFGAAKLRASAPRSKLTAAGQTIGTPWYMSPEQARGAELDARSDQWGTAVVLYEMLTGRLPFANEDPVQVLHQIVEDPHTPVRVLAPELPEGLEAVFGRAFAKRPEDRFDSVEQLAHQVAALLDPDSLDRARTAPIEAVAVDAVVAPAAPPPPSPPPSPATVVPPVVAAQPGRPEARRRFSTLGVSAVAILAAVVGVAAVARLVTLREQGPERPMPLPQASPREDRPAMERPKSVAKQVVVSAPRAAPAIMAASETDAGASVTPGRRVESKPAAAKARVDFFQHL